jgi:multidrug efflux system membrane fusion protein
VLVGGVKAGQTIVTAGVNLLKNGQKVSILQETPAVPAPAAPRTATAAATPAGAAK